MTQDEQNEQDLIRMAGKRNLGCDLIRDFAKWHCSDEPSESENLILWGLKRDMLLGTESEVDRLIASLEERNQQAAMDKLETGLDNS